jgi:hypothetical protein
MGVELHTDLRSSSEGSSKVPVTVWSKATWPYYAHQLVPYSVVSTALPLLHNSCSCF